MHVLSKNNFVTDHFQQDTRVRSARTRFTALETDAKISIVLIEGVT